jgi:hypothetical protein
LPDGLVLAAQDPLGDGASAAPGAFRAVACLSKRKPCLRKMARFERGVNSGYD